MKRKVLIIMLFISVCVSTAFPDQPLAVMPEDVEQKVDLLERRGEYKSARVFLRNEYLKTGNVDILLKWIEMDKEVFDRLRRSDNHFSIQEWTPYVHSANETKTEKTVRWSKYFVSVPLDWMGGFGMASGSAVAGQTEYDRRKEFEYESSHPVYTLSKSQIQSTLDKYKMLKHSHSDMMRILDQLMVQSSGDILNTAIELKKAQKSYFEDVAKRRCNYISYDTISPALNRTKQLIFLSENAEVLSIGHSMDYLRDAVEFMGQGAGDQQLILEAEPDARMQFMDVYRLLKETAGTAEFEELKVFAKLQDKIGGERSLGYQRWMDQ
jgi:hypothetical protein